MKVTQIAHDSGKASPMVLPDKSSIVKVASFIVATFLLSPVTSPASVIAFDDTSDPQYSSGNFNGIFGGFGFDAWQNSPAANDDGSGSFVGDSNANGGGSGPGINSGNGAAFGLYANSGNQSEAVRDFWVVLNDGYSFSIDIDTGWLDGENSAQGFSLRNAIGENRFEFFYRAGASSYYINDNAFDVPTGIPFTEGGLRVVVTVISENTYDVRITVLSSDSTTELTGRTLGGSSGSRISQVRIFNYNNFSGGSERDLFVNNLSMDCGEVSCAITQTSGSNPGCPDSIATFEGPEGDYEYYWMLDNNTSGAYIIGSEDQRSVTVNYGSDLGSFELALEVVQSGCASVCSVFVDVQATPTPVADNNSPICVGGELILTATPIDNATYTWVGPDFFMSTEQNPIIVDASILAAGTYSVSASVNGCPSEIATTDVSIYFPPDCLISGEENVCANQEFIVYFAPDDQVYYQWSITGDGTITSSDDGGSIRVTAASEGSYTLTLEIRDNNGCSTFCEMTVNIGDTEAPEIIVPDDVLLDCNADFSVEELGEAIVADNCDFDPIVTYSDEIIEGGCSHELVVLRTWSAIDEAGNIATEVQTITLADMEPPVIILPPEAFIECSDDDSPESLGYAEVFDNCDSEPLLEYYDVIIPMDDCDYMYMIERTWRAVDACGNESEELQTVFVEDFSNPEMVVPEDVELEAGADFSPEALGFATATDNCDPDPSISYFDDIFDGECPGDLIIERFWYAEDACGNMAEGMQTIMVRGESQIELIVPDDVVVSCDMDTSAETHGYAAATDAFGDELEVFYMDEIIEGECAGSFVIERTWLAEDNCGNAAEAVQILTVVDDQAPMITVPSDIAIVCGEDSSPEAIGLGFAYDNCDAEPSIGYTDEIVAGACGGQYVILRTWRGEDACGNSAEAVQTITVVDEIAPELSIPADVSIACGEDSSPEAVGLAFASDNCDAEVSATYADVIIEGDCAGSYTIERTWRAEDSCGNAVEAVQTITVVDVTAPELTIPADAAVDCGADTSPESLGSATASDGCDTSPAISFSDVTTAGDCAGSYTIERTWRAEDACGNAVEAVQVITVSDNSAPALTVPADASVDCGSDTSAEALGLAGAVDACDANPGVSYVDSIVAGECDSSFVIERTWRAEDACGNAVEAVQVITVSDNSAPALTIPADAIVGCGESTGTGALGMATALDGCDASPSISYSDVIMEGECPNNFTIERTWRAEDACGNAVEAVQVITVSDTTAPVLTIPANVAVGCGESSDPSGTGTATATDGCGGDVIVTYTDDTLDGVISRTWTATDACGNIASAVQTISTSGGGGSGVISWQGKALQVVTASCGQPVFYEEPTATSDCGPNPTVVCTPPSGSKLNSGINIIKCVATDASGKKSKVLIAVVVLEPLRVVVQSPLKDDNIANDIETDNDVVNEFKAGSALPHKVKLYDCSGRDVTKIMSLLVDVNLDVTQRQYAGPGNSVLVKDLPEKYNGVGGPNGKMMPTGNHFQYNLDTKGYPSGTINNATFIRSLITVNYKLFPEIIVGQEDVLLESKK